MGVDFGLSKINSTLTDISNGDLILDSELRYAWDVQANNWMETNPEQLWEVSQRVAEDLVSRYDREKVEIKAIVLSCFGETIVPVDSEGNHLYPIMGSNDIRAQEECRAIAENIPDYSGITGGNVAAASASSKILWIRSHKPEVFEKTAYFYSLQQYILKKMGMDPLNDYTLAARKMMFDAKEYTWSSKICGFLGVTGAQMGETGSSSTVVGEADGNGQAIFPTRVPVVIGPHNACSSALGLGIRPFNEDGRIGNNSGTWNLMNLYYRGFTDASMRAPRLTPGCGPVKGSYYVQAAGAVGPLFDWFVRTFCREEGLSAVSRRAVYDGTCRVRLLKDPMEGNGVICGLSLENGISDVFAGIVESVTFPMKEMLKEFEHLAGRHFEAMRISAGGAKADNWVQLKADVMNLKMERVANLQASALGAAINAAIGIGAYKDYDEAIKAMVRVDKVFEPNPEMVKVYEERSQEFLDQSISGPCFFL